MRGVAVALALVCGVSPALKAQSSTKSRACEPSLVDSSRYTVSPLYRNCDVDVPAKLKHQPEPPYDFPPGVGCATTELTFVVDTTGKWIPGTQAVEFADDDEYAKVLIKSLSDWRYQPAILNGKPVAQLVYVKFARQNGRVPFSVGRLKPGDVVAPSSRTPSVKPTVCASSRPL